MEIIKTKPVSSSKGSALKYKHFHGLLMYQRSQWVQVVPFVPQLVKAILRNRSAVTEDTEEEDITPLLQ